MKECPRCGSGLTPGSKSPKAVRVRANNAETLGLEIARALGLNKGGTFFLYRDHNGIVYCSKVPLKGTYKLVVSDSAEPG